MIKHQIIHDTRANGTATSLSDVFGFSSTKQTNSKKKTINLDCLFLAIVQNGF